MAVPGKMAASRRDRLSPLENPLLWYRIGDFPSPEVVSCCSAGDMFSLDGSSCVAGDLAVFCVPLSRHSEAVVSTAELFDLSASWLSSMDSEFAAEKRFWISFRVTPFLSDDEGVSKLMSYR